MPATPVVQEGRLVDDLRPARHRRFGGCDGGNQRRVDYLDVAVEPHGFQDPSLVLDALLEEQLEELVCRHPRLAPGAVGNREVPCGDVPAGEKLRQVGRAHH